MSRELIKTDFTVYWLFDAPRAAGRTGHGALAILSGNELVCFFSMYHDHKPTEVSRCSLLDKITGSFKSCVIESLEDELIMRGQSWERLEDLKQKEDIAVGELLSTLPINPDSRKKLLQRGKYQYARKIPDVDPYAVMDALSQMKKASWALFAPFIQYIGDPTAHNCCSAIWSALEKGGINKHQNNLISQTPASLKFAFWASYFSFIAFAPVSKPSSDDTVSVILYAPLVYFFVVLLQSLKNAYDYVTDLTSMAKDPKNISLLTRFLIYSLCTLVNTVGATVSDNACFDLFKFPVCVDRELKKRPGAVITQLDFDRSFASKNKS